MAVNRVFGRVDGVDVVLNKTAGDRWSVPVPFDVDGEYVVEIIAEDEAGNQAYMAKMLFIVNAATLCVHVIPVPFYGVLQDDNLALDIMGAAFTGVVLDNERNASLCSANYYAEVIEPVCNLKGGR